MFVLPYLSVPTSRCRFFNPFPFRFDRNPPLSAPLYVPHFLSRIFRDPQRVAQCLHVLNRVVQDTVPDFVGPFLTEANPSTPSITADSSGGGAQDASDRQNELSSSSQHWPWPTTGATISSPQEEGHQQQQYRQQQQSPRHQHHEQHHPRPPSPSERPRPLSLPSRFSTASPADDTMWNSLFPSPASRPQVRIAAVAFGTVLDGVGSSGRRRT